MFDTSDHDDMALARLLLAALCLAPGLAFDKDVMLEAKLDRAFTAADALIARAISDAKAGAK